MSQLVNLKFQPELLQEVDKTVDEGLYPSRAEFIRDAVRRLILELRREYALRMLETNFGKGKGKTPVLDEKRKQRIYREYLKEKGYTSSGVRAKKPERK